MLPLKFKSRHLVRIFCVLPTEFNRYITYVYHLFRKRLRYWDISVCFEFLVPTRWIMVFLISQKALSQQYKLITVWKGIITDYINAHDKQWKHPPKLRMCISQGSRTFCGNVWPPEATECCSLWRGLWETTCFFVNIPLWFGLHQRSAVGFRFFLNGHPLKQHQPFGDCQSKT